MDLGQRPVWEPQVVELSNVGAIAQALDLDENVARILVQRGIRTLEEARQFLCPAVDQLHDPFLLPDAEIAIDRLLVAVERRE